MSVLLKILLAILFNVLFYSFAFAIELAEINNFRVVKFNLHLIQAKSRFNYLTDAKIEYATRQTIEKFLPLNKTPDSPILNLEIFLHLNLSQRDAVSYIIQGSSDNSLILDYKSPVLSAPFSNQCAAIDDYEKVVCAVPGILLGRHIVQVLSDLTSNFDYGKDVKEEDLLAFQNQLVEAINKKFLYSKNTYIPDSVTAPLIADINNKKDRERIKNYNRIIHGWIYTPELQNAITNKINELMLTTTADSDNKELRYAMNALASLGDESTIDIFKKIEKIPNLPSDVAKEVQDSVVIYNDRRLLARRIHNTANFNSMESWEINQLYNRLGLPTDIELISAMKEIFEKYPNNKMLLDKLASILEEDMRHEVWREEVDAWICKVIEKSRNTNYLPLVQSVESKAKSEKIRDYAKSAKKHLAKLK